MQIFLLCIASVNALQKAVALGGNTSAGHLLECISASSRLEFQSSKPLYRDALTLELFSCALVAFRERVVGIAAVSKSTKGQRGRSSLVVTALSLVDSEDE